MLCELGLNCLTDTTIFAKKVDSMNHFGHSGSTRRGLSFLEFVGCLVALVGGVALGAMYLGIDVAAMAVGAIEKSELAPDEDSAMGQKFAAVKEALGVEATTTPAEDQTDPGTADEASGDAPTESTAAVSTSDVSTVYWHAVRSALTEEARARSAAVEAKENVQLFDYLTRRKTGHDDVVKRIDALDTDDVDPRVLEYTDRAKQWHQAGADLYGNALDLLAASPGAELTGPLGQSWQNGATQHRMEERLLLERRQTLESYLQHRRTSQEQE